MFSFIARHLYGEEREGYILPGRERRDQVEGLEDKTDVLPPEKGEFVLCGAGNVLAVKIYVAGRGTFKAGEDGQECRLSAPRFSDKADEFSGSELYSQVLYSFNPEGGQMLRDLVDKTFKCTWLPMRPMSLVLGAHTGRSMVGLAFAPAELMAEIP